MKSTKIITTRKAIQDLIKVAIKEKDDKIEILEWQNSILISEKLQAEKQLEELRKQK